jgi:hypothetical protein
MAKLSVPAVPNFPNGGNEYDIRYQNELNNILRLFLQRERENLGALVGVLGGQYLELPHIAASDSTDQYAPANNTAVKVVWDTLDSGAGFTLNPDSTATPDQTGIYKIDYSLQLVNTNNASHDVVVWLQINGTQVPGSTSKFTVPARKSAGVYSFIVAYSSITFTIGSDDAVALWWATDKAYNPVGPVDGVYMEAIPAQTVPYAHPSAPSAIGSITFVSRLP